MVEKDDTINIGTCKHFGFKLTIKIIKMLKVYWRKLLTHFMRFKLNLKCVTYIQCRSELHKRHAQQIMHYRVVCP